MSEVDIDNLNKKLFEIKGKGKRHASYLFGNMEDVEITRKELSSVSMMFPTVWGNLEEDVYLLEVEGTVSRRLGGGRKRFSLEFIAKDPNPKAEYIDDRVERMIKKVMLLKAYLPEPSKLYQT